MTDARLAFDSERSRPNRFRRVSAARFAKVLYPAASIVLVLIVWKGLTTIGGIPRYLLPPPEEVLQTVFSQAHQLFRHGNVTLLEVVLGYVAAILVGVPLAVVMAGWRPAELFLNSLIVAPQNLPKSALAPLFVLWFGFGLAPKVVIAMLIAFFPILVATLTGLKGVGLDMVRLGQSMGLSPFKMFALIRLPAALPAMFAGFKIAITLALIGAIVAEFVAADAGLGYLLIISQSQFQTSLLFACLLVLAVMGVALYSLITALERLLIPWHVSARRSEHGS